MIACLPACATQFRDFGSSGSLVCMCPCVAMLPARRTMLQPHFGEQCENKLQEKSAEEALETKAFWPKGPGTLLDQDQKTKRTRTNKFSMPQLCFQPSCPATLVSRLGLPNFEFGIQTTKRVPRTGCKYSCFDTKLCHNMLSGTLGSGPFCLSLSDDGLLALNGERFADMLLRVETRNQKQSFFMELWAKGC